VPGRSVSAAMQWRWATIRSGKTELTLSQSESGHLLSFGQDAEAASRQAPQPE